MIKRVLFLTVGILSLMLAACETKAINNGKKENKMKTIELTKADFLKKIVDYEKNPEEWIYLGDKPAIIDFYASWCGPCKMQSPIFEALSEELAGKVKFGSVNVDEQAALALKYQVMSIPMLVVMQYGIFKKKAIGLQTREEILDLLACCEAE